MTENGSLKAAVGELRKQEGILVEMETLLPDGTAVKTRPDATGARRSGTTGNRQVSRGPDDPAAHERRE